jgi:hypothetical protein
VKVPDGAARYSVPVPVPVLVPLLVGWSCVVVTLLLASM